MKRLGGLATELSSKAQADEKALFLARAAFSLAVISVRAGGNPGEKEEVRGFSP